MPTHVLQFCGKHKNPAKGDLACQRDLWILSLPSQYIDWQRSTKSWSRTTWKPHSGCPQNDCRFTLKWLTQKPDLVNRDWFAKAIRDPRSRPKGLQTLKRPWSFKVWSRTERFYDSIKSNQTGFSSVFSNSLFWSSAFLIISNNSSASEEGYCKDDRDSALFSTYTPPPPL